MKPLIPVKENKINKYRKEHTPAQQKQTVVDYLADNSDKFGEAMDDVFEHDKKGYAKLYIDMSKAVMPKESTVDVKVGISKDMEKLIELRKATSEQELIDAQPAEEIEDISFEAISAKNKVYEDEKKEEEALPLPTNPLS